MLTTRLERWRNQQRRKNITGEEEYKRDMMRKRQPQAWLRYTVLGLLYQLQIIVRLLSRQGFTCELSKKLLGREIGDAVEVPAIAMATVWLIRLLPSPSTSSPLLPITAPWGTPGRPHWLWDSSNPKMTRKKIN